MLHIYCTGVGKNAKLSHAMQEGTRAPIVPPAPLREGDVFMYGALRGLLPTLQKAQREGRTWYYADNAYMRKEYGYFRITKNALQHDGAGKFHRQRWLNLHLTINPWRKTGSHIIVAPPDPIYGELWGMDPIGWLSDVVTTLRAHTDRPIEIRRKILSQLAPGTPPLTEHLKDAWALVTCSSNVAVDALLAGVPVFCSAPCASYRMGTPNLACIENPIMPDDRERWAAALAANQWTVAEMRSGLCWQELQTR